MNEPVYTDIATDDTQKPIRERKAAPKPESTKHLRVLANGAVYDTIKKRIVTNKPELAIKNTQITSETAGAMQAISRDRKKEAMIRAANRVAMQGGSVSGEEFSGDLAFVEAVSESMTMKALTPTDAGAERAAKWLFDEIGISERRETQQGEAVSDLSAALAGLLEFMNGRSAGVIDADVIDMRSDLQDDAE